MNHHDRRVFPDLHKEITRKDSEYKKWRRGIIGVGQDCEIVIVDDTIDHNLH